MMAAVFTIDDQKQISHLLYFAMRMGKSSMMMTFGVGHVFAISKKKFDR